MPGWQELSLRSSWCWLLGSAGRIAVQQSWAYGEAVAAAGHAVCRLGWQEGATTRAVLQLHRRRLPLGLTAALVLRGPVWLAAAPDPTLEDRLMRALAPWTGRTALLWQPDDGSVRGRRAGVRRLWTGASIVLLDLAPPLDRLRAGLDGKWRNMLKAAEGTGLTVRIDRSGPRLDWLVAEAERQRLARGYAGPAPAFTQRLAAASGADCLCLTGEADGTPVAGMLLVRHGPSATYQLGATTALGRRLRAHHRLLWAGIGALKEQGCTTLDLGLVDTVSQPGIARFKLGSGGRPLTLAGSYLLPPRLGGGAPPE